MNSVRLTPTVSKAAKTDANTATATRTVLLTTQCAIENLASVSVPTGWAADSVTSVNLVITGFRTAGLASVTITQTLVTLKQENARLVVITLRGTTVMSAWKVTMATRVRVTAESVCARMGLTAPGNTLPVACWTTTPQKSPKCVNVTQDTLGRNVQCARLATGEIPMTKTESAEDVIATVTLTWSKVHVIHELANA